MNPGPNSVRPTPVLRPAAGENTQNLLEQSLAELEAHLATLGVCLRERNAEGLERSASELHAALSRSIGLFARAAQVGQLPGELRRRLIHTSSMVASQRESLARATAALDRAIDVLIPQAGPKGYSAQGKSSRGLGGSIF
jgi:hypothetical protein